VDRRPNDGDAGLDDGGAGLDGGGAIPYLHRFVSMFIMRVGSVRNLVIIVGEGKPNSTLKGHQRDES
jgi:hypothetical protein